MREQRITTHILIVTSIFDTDTDKAVGGGYVIENNDHKPLSYASIHYDPYVKAAQAEPATLETAVLYL